MKYTVPSLDWCRKVSEVHRGTWERDLLENDSFPVSIKKIGLKKGASIFYPAFGGGQWLWRVCTDFKPSYCLAVEIDKFGVEYAKRKFSNPKHFLAEFLFRLEKAYFNVNSVHTMVFDGDWEGALEAVERAAYRIPDQEEIQKFLKHMEKQPEIEVDFRTGDAFFVTPERKFDYCFSYESEGPCCLDEFGVLTHARLLSYCDEMVRVAYPHSEAKLRAVHGSLEKMGKWLERIYGISTDVKYIKAKCWWANHPGSKGEYGESKRCAFEVHYFKNRGDSQDLFRLDMENLKRINDGDAPVGRSSVVRLREMYKKIPDSQDEKPKKEGIVVRV